MPLLQTTKAAEYAGGSAGGYLNPSKIPLGKSARFALYPDLIEYFETWGEKTDGKRQPVRFATEPTPADVESAMRRANLNHAINKHSGDPEGVKYVLTFAVYEYDSGEVKVLPLSQPTIRNQLSEFDNKPDYDPITDWDLELSKKDDNGFTKYTLMILPRRKTAQAAMDAAWEEAQENGFDLSRLITNGNPFKAER